MTTAVAPYQGSSALSPTGRIDEDFVMLDRYAADGLAEDAGETRINALATISAGYRGTDKRPMRTKEGEIYVHGDAPCLEQMLDARDRKSLTIMFPSDRISDFIQQKFTCYSATKLELWGDEKQLTWFSPKGRVTLLAGTPQYEEALKSCKVSVSVYFMLAEWTANGTDAVMVFDDGFGLYRLRFTSSNSLRGITSSLKYVAAMTKGRIAGIPFELSLRFEEHADPTGVKRTVPIWQCVPRSPQGQRFTVSLFRSLMQSGQEQREMLTLPAAHQETIEDAQADAIIEVTEAELEAAASGGRGEKDHWNRTWHATVAGTHLEPDHARHEFIERMTNGACSSLSTFLEKASDEEARMLIEAAKSDIQQAINASGTNQPTNAAPDAAEVNDEQWDAAFAAYEVVAKRTIELGGRHNPLAENISYKSLVSRTQVLEEAIALKEAALARAASESRFVESAPEDAAAPAPQTEAETPAPAAVEEPNALAAAEDAGPAPDLELTPDPPTDSMGEPLTPLGTALRAAAAYTADDQAEADRVFSGAPEPAIVLPDPDPSDYQVQPHTNELLEAFRQSGHNTMGDLGDHAAVLTVNKWYALNQMGKNVDDLGQVTAEEVAKIKKVLRSGALAVPGSKPLETPDGD